MQWQQGVFIEQLHLYGDQAHRRALLSSLDSQPWPGEDSEQIILIDQLSVSGPWWEIGQKAADAADQIAQTNPRQTNQGQGDNSQRVIRFTDRLELLSRFAEDSSQTQLNQWYWPLLLDTDQTVRPDHLLNLLDGQITLLPALLSRLSNREQLIPLIRQLSPTTWQQLLQRVASQLRIAPEALRVEPPPPDTAPQSAQPAAPNHWQNAQHQLDRHCQQSTPLIALCYLWQTKPHLLTRTGMGNRTDMVSYCLNTFYCNLHYSSGTKPASHFNPGRRPETEPMREHASQSQDGFLSGQALSQSGHSQSGQALSQTKIHDVSTQERGDEFKTNQDKINQDRHETHETQYTTQCAGTLYLINAFLQVRITEMVQKSTISPWVFIYRVAKTLAEPDPSITQFIADQAECDVDNLLNQVNKLHEQSLVEEPLQKQLQRLTHFYQPTGLWQPELIKLPARIKVQGPNIRLVTDLSQVRTDIRLHGLDINPGWQPWLGQVITFEFGDYPEFARRDKYLQRAHQRTPRL
jgi:hypothetical protein